MQTWKYKLPIATLLVLLSSGMASAHSGGTNSAGCHTNHSTGDYHCHNSGSSGGGSTNTSPYTPIQYNPCLAPNEEINGRCLDPVNACIEKYGSKSEWSNDGCGCRDGYELKGGTCVESTASSSSKKSSSSKSSSASVQDGVSVQVVSVSDGDTFKFKVGSKTETVRIIGIDTPETVHPSKPVQCFGIEASTQLKEHLTGQEIILQKNPAEERDKYGRLLRYVELDGEDIGAHLIEEGYAYSYKQYPHPRLEEYNELEREARESGRGLWAGCDDDAEVTTAKRQATVVAFADVSANHPYQQAIQWGKDNSVLNGYSDGSFKPDNVVNRAEFLKIVLAAKGVDVSNDNSPIGFSDVDENGWYAPYLRYAKAHGIIQGYADGTFKPEQPVNFAEALKMAYVALGIEGDVSANGEWYEKYLKHAKRQSVLFSNNADVGAGMSRKDVVWIVWRLQNGEGQTSSVSRSSVSSTKSTVSKSSKSSSASSVSTSGSCDIKGNISTDDEEKIYHVPGCGSYNQTKINESAGERWFCSEEEAEEAGWRKALNCP